MDEELELSDEVRELFLAGKLDALLEHVAQVGAEATRERELDKSRARAKKRREDPDYVARQNEYSRRWAEERRKTDPEFRERRLSYSRSNKEYFQRYYQDNKERYAETAKLRRAEKLKDPAWAAAQREKDKLRMRAVRARKKAEKEAQENND